MKIEILGSGCSKCERLYSNVQNAVKELNLDAKVLKVTDIDKITEYGILMTPALVIDGKVRSSGKVLPIERIKELIQ